jgi:hypothetical protein
MNHQTNKTGLLEEKQNPLPEAKASATQALHSSPSAESLGIRPTA